MEKPEPTITIRRAFVEGMRNDLQFAINTIEGLRRELDIANAKVHVLDVFDRAFARTGSSYACSYQPDATRDLAEIRDTLLAKLLDEGCANTADPSAGGPIEAELRPGGTVIGEHLPAFDNDGPAIDPRVERARAALRFEEADSDNAVDEAFDAAVAEGVAR